MKTASYGMVIVVGIGVTGVIAYTVLNVRYMSVVTQALLAFHCLCIPTYTFSFDDF